jgi:hypothetical protein
MTPRIRGLTLGLMLALALAAGPALAAPITNADVIRLLDTAEVRTVGFCAAAANRFFDFGVD